jgi:hypothetical protein
VFGGSVGTHFGTAYDTVVDAAPTVLVTTSGAVLLANLVEARKAFCFIADAAAPVAAGMPLLAGTALLLCTGQLRRAGIEVRTLFATAT